jgi:hypothetical protein
MPKYWFRCFFKYSQAVALHRRDTPQYLNSSRGGTWVDPMLFERAEGTRYGDWSSRASSQIQYNWLTIPSTVDTNAPHLFDFRCDVQGCMPVTGRYDPCTGRALGHGAVDIGLDAVGLIPEGSACERYRALYR